MPTIDDVRRILGKLPGVEERVGGHTGAPAWRVARGDVVWVRGPSGRDLEQLAALGRSWPDGEVIGVRVESLDAKDVLLAAEPEAFFTIPHFDGYPAVLVHVEAIAPDRLEEILVDAWLVRAPARVAKVWLAEKGLS
ncbi:MAG: hypothetical protein QM708_13475 [Propioniciclava sp.]|uniref:MmcQ/YjbR family DNA-binding protein n=1 Tax=Propioniciclava sp. TaxID=2038686 RepID=UPI0039E69A9B